MQTKDWATHGYYGVLWRVIATMSVLIVATNLSPSNIYSANASNINEKGIYASIIIVLSKLLGQNDQNVPISAVLGKMTRMSLSVLSWAK